MNKVGFLVLISLLAGCEPKRASSEIKESNTDELKPIHSSIADSLFWYQKNQKPISKRLYKELFKSQLLEGDQVIISSIPTPVKSIYPIIATFNTVESDQIKQYVNIHLFDKNWKLLGSKGLKYEIDYDLFSLDYRFLSDSTIEITAQEGLGFDTEDYLKKVFIIELNEKTLFDTLILKVDTIMVIE